MTRVDIKQNYTNFHKTLMSFINVNFYKNEPLMFRSQKGLQRLLSQYFNYVHENRRWNNIFKARLGFDGKREQELPLLSPIKVVFPLSKWDLLCSPKINGIIDFLASECIFIIMIEWANQTMNM